MTNSLDLADELHDLTIQALQTCTPTQRTIFQLRTGITNNGTTTPLTINEIAQQLNLSTSSIITHQAFAESKVYRHINLNLIRKEQTRRAETMFDGTPTLGTTPNYPDVRIHITNTGSSHTHGAIKLGEGSEAMIRASKHSHPRQQQAIIKAHQRYTKP